MGALDSTEVTLKEENGQKKVDIDSAYFEKEGFWGEYKFDGSRYVLQWDAEGKVYFTSRNISVNTNEPVDKTENLRGYLYDDNTAVLQCAIDGEVLSKYFLKGNGSSIVNKVMLAKPERAKETLKEIDLYYVVYDCLEYFGVNVQNKPLEERRQYLVQILRILNNPKIVLSPVIKHDKATFVELLEKGYEGMMIKDRKSVYEQDKHSKSWQKVKKLMSFDGVVMGCTLGTGKYRGNLGALIVGQYFDGVLKEVCTISGMTDEQRSEFFGIIKMVAHRITDDKIIFTDILAANWVVEFTAQERTSARYRHPRFIQNRVDKAASQCIF